MEFEILTSGYFNESALTVNGEVLGSANGEVNAKDFLSSLYKKMALDYPKFHKMDLLCKVGILLSDILIRDLNSAQKEHLEDMAVVFNNSTSSLDSDVKHQSTLKEGQPSPAIFVYTLPNIVIGEICIKHKIYGENMFLVSSTPDTEILTNYVGSMLDNGKCKQCLVGWIDAFGDEWSLALAIVKMGSSDKKLSKTLDELFSEVQVRL